MPARPSRGRSTLVGALVLALLTVGVSIAPAGAAPSDPAISVASRQVVGHGWTEPDRTTIAGDAARVGHPAFYEADEDGRLWFHGRTPTGGFVAPVVVAEGFATVATLLGGADLDRDGVPDLVAIFGDALVLFPGERSGALGDRQLLGRGWAGVEHVTMLPFAAGGRPGIVAVDADGRAQVSTTDGSGRIADVVDLGDGWDDVAHVAGGSDWDRNGCSDLLVVDEDGDLELHALAGERCDERSTSSLGTVAAGTTWLGVTEARAQGGFWTAVWTTDEAGHLTRRTAVHAVGPGPTHARGVLVVNKTFPLPPAHGSGLTPGTAAAFALMRDEAARDGLDLFVVSGYRSHAYQAALYDDYVDRHGAAAADRFSARPGHSEHQAGLGIDLNSVSEEFGTSPEGRWVAENAHRFGFVVRYPDGAEEITGYRYEPWHLRYVGRDLASYLHRSGETLEEYLNVWSAYR